MIKISIYSGKCDMYDVVIAIHEYTLEELQNNVKIYVGGSNKPLHINSMADLIPYYPYIVAMSYFNNTERHSVIRLSSKSFVDTEEMEILSFYKNQILKIYNKCMKHNEVFSIDKISREIGFYSNNKEIIIELAKRVDIYGGQADMSGLHLPSHDFYRRELVDEMLRNGLNPADYGYERFGK